MPRTKEGAKKRKEDLLTHRGITSRDFSEGGSGSGTGRNLRPRAEKRRAEPEENVGSENETSSEDDVEDETFVDYSAFELRKRHGKGVADVGDDDEEEEEDLGGQERDGDDDDDPMEEDGDSNAGAVKITKPMYFYPDQPINFHGDGKIKALKKLRDKNPYASARTASDQRFWAKFQQDFYTTVIIKKPKITHMAQYVD